MDWKKINREDLYELVWQKPMMHLAKEFNLSDRGLAKACQRMEIPRPGYDYWPKLQHNQIVEKVPLLPASKTCTLYLEYETSCDRSYSDIYKYDFVKEAIAYENNPENHISVPKKIQNVHPLVEMTIRSMKKPHFSRYDLWESSGQDTLGLTCSEELIPRAGNILNSLVIALETRGYEVSGEAKKIIVFVEEEKVELVFREGLKKIVNEGRGYGGGEQHEYLPKGELRIQIEAFGCWASSNFKRNFTDTKNTNLEGKLNELILSIVKTSALIKEGKLERQRWEDKCEYERKLKQQKSKNAEALEYFYQDWQKSKSLEKMLSQIEASNSDFEIGLISKQEWLIWAKAHIKELSWAWQ